MIAEAPPPKSFADQLVAAQPTRLSSAAELQPHGLVAARLKVIAIPALIAAAGFGVIVGLWFGLLLNVQSDFSGVALTAAAIVLMWTVVGLALRQMQVVVSWRRIFAIALGWAIAVGLGAGLTYALGNVLFYGRSPDSSSILLLLTIFGAVCGLAGGQLTGRILRVPVSALRLKTTTWGWTIAWVAGGGAFMLLGWNAGSEAAGRSLAVCGALIGAIGGGTMFWQIARARDVTTIDATVIDSQPRSQPGSATINKIDLLSSAVRAIGIICGGWIALELFVVLIGQQAETAADTATYISLSFGVGSLAVAYVLQRAVPSMRRTAWLLTAGWSLATIGAVQLGVLGQIDSNWLSVVAVGVCGVIAAWAVFRDTPGVPRWQYVVIGVIWMLTYAIGSGYAWHMIVYKAQHYGWRMADTMNALGLDVFALTLGAILSAVAGGVALYQLAARAHQTSGDAVETHQGSTR